MLVLMLFTIGVSYSQIRIPKEKFSIGMFLDPHASLKENSPDIGVEFGLESAIYAKVQIETLPGLTGGYTSVGGAIGLNAEFGQNMPHGARWYVYTGVRLMPWVFRNNDVQAAGGFEAGFDINLGKNFYVGLRATRDDRRDMDLLGYPRKKVNSGFIRTGFRFDLKK